MAEVKQFCEYVSRSRIGGGQYGQVYSVYRNAQGQDVALKYIPKDAASLRVGIEFPLELDIVQRLDHPNLIHAEEIRSTIDPNCEELNGLAIIMPMAETDLESILDVAWTANEKVSAMHQLLSGLAFLHAQNILHLDIKPGNIVIIGNRLKFIDFGLALKVDDVANPEYTQIIRVTSDYRPPENFRVVADPESDYGDVQIYSEKTDIWSLGLVFLSIYAGNVDLLMQTIQTFHIPDTK